MEGQRIELEDRRNCTFSRLVQVRKEENSDSDDSCCRGYVSEVSHKFARPRLANGRTQKKLAIKQLELPMLNAQCTEKAKSAAAKQSKRRRNKLGLKPIKLLRRKANVERRRQSIDEGRRDLERHAEDANEHDPYVGPAVNYDVNNVDFDFDVLRLIMNAECNNGAQNVGERKTIRFAPCEPSPRTVQVIRVDVTASARAAQDGRRAPTPHEDDEDDYCGRFRRDYGLEQKRANRASNRCERWRNYCKLGTFCAHAAQPHDDLDFVVMCKKLTLSPKD